MKETVAKLLSADFATSHALPALLVAVVAILAGRLAGRAARRLARHAPNSDLSLQELAGNFAAWCIWAFGAVAALKAIGVDTGGIMAALGGVAIAIGLGLRDTLSNVAAGLSLLVLRPLAVGEFVTFSGSGDARSSGTVVKVGLFETELKTVEGVFLSVPNRILLQEPIANYGRNKERLIRLVFSISYSDSVDTGLRVLHALAEAEPRRLKDKPPEVFVEALSESSVDLALRIWTTTADYWPARRALLKDGKAALEKAGLTIPFPQRDVHVKDRT